jgi:hypothetical protein
MQAAARWLKHSKSPVLPAIWRLNPGYRCGKISAPMATLDMLVAIQKMLH